MSGLLILIEFISFAKNIMQQEELVSVIMPTYNAGKFLADSINSILQQTHKNLELLITDDASTDAETIQTLKNFALKDKRVNVVFLQENHGPGYARNQSINRAKGRYIAFCDSDDRWTDDKIEKQIAFMNKKQCALCCASYIICDENDINTRINIPPKIITYNMMKRDNKIGCLTGIYDTKILGRKYFMPTIRKRQDWALFLEIMKQSHVCYAYTEKPLAYYRIRKNSISNNKKSLIKYNIAVYRKILGFNLIKSYFYFFALFIPSYTWKIVKRSIDSKKYLKVIDNG